MKYILTGIFLFLIIGNTFIFSQIDSNKISFVAYWNVGDKCYYLHEITKFDILPKTNDTLITKDSKKGNIHRSFRKNRHKLRPYL